MLETLLEIAERSLKDYRWEIYFQKKRVLYADSKNLHIDKLKKAVDLGFSVRVEKNGKVGFSYGTVITEKDIQDVINRALANADISEEYDLYLSSPVETERVEYYDTFAVEQLPEREKIFKAVEVEEKAYKKDERIKTVRVASFQETVVEKSIINSEGVNIYEKGSIYSSNIAVLASYGKDSQIAWDLTSSRFFGELDIESMVQEAVDNAVSLLGAKPIKTQKIPVLFPPYAMTEMLYQFFPMFSGESLLKGKTVFKDLKNKDIFPEELIIVDNGRLHKGIGSFTYDDEGVPTQETVLIEKKRFKRFLHNLYTAKKTGEISTGNGKRDFKNLPEVGITNFYLQKTDKDIQNFLKEKTYFKIIELIGLHTADTVTGDFSVGATGILFVNGEPVQSVKEVTLAGNFVELLKSIVFIGKDLKFYGNVGSPSVFVRELMIAGI